MRRFISVRILCCISVLLLAVILTSFSKKPATTVTSGEMKIKTKWVQKHLLKANSRLPFSFLYDGKASSELLNTWQIKSETKKLDQNRTQYHHIWKDNQTGLEVRCVSVEYWDYPVVEWTVYIKNAGTTNTPILKDIQGLDAAFQRGSEGEFVLNGIKGDFCTADSYEPYQLQLVPNFVKKFSPIPPVNPAMGPMAGHITICKCQMADSFWQ